MTTPRQKAGTTRSSSRPANTEHTRVGDSIRHAGESVDHFSEKVGEKTDKIIHKGEEIASEIHHKTKEYSEKAVEYVKKNPVKSTVIAGVVGIIIGRLLKR